MTTQEIIDALSNYTNKLPRAALSEAPQHKEELIPHLLGDLDYVCDNAEKLMAEKSPYNLYFFSMFLLAQFREKQAFLKLLRFLRKDKEVLDYFFGDAVTEAVDRCLYCVYDGNLELLKKLIEDTNVYVYARDSALLAYTYIVRDGRITRGEMIDYFRYLIRERLIDDTSDMLTMISSCIIDEHLFELIPDVKFLYDRDVIDHFMNGGYDNFIDHIFYYSPYQKKLFIDDVVKELEYWAAFKEEPKAKPIAPAEKPLAEHRKKIGRNDPCPCGSGKKYKKCCLPLGVQFNNAEKEESEDISESFINMFREMKASYKNESYDLMQDYPRREPSPIEGQRTITEFYSAKAIEIDIPVYKALCHRSIPIFVKRNHRKEDLERIDFLLEAFEMFTQTCDEENLKSFAAFDSKYMVHYESANWVESLSNLLDEYEDELPLQKIAIRETVNAALARMATPDREANLK